MPTGHGRFPSRWWKPANRNGTNERCALRPTRRPSSPRRGSTREAKKICTGCEVRAECLAYALAHDERFGIWGGLSERERRRLKRAAG